MIRLLVASLFLLACAASADAYMPDTPAMPTMDFGLMRKACQKLTKTRAKLCSSLVTRWENNSYGAEYHFRMEKYALQSHYIGAAEKHRLLSEPFFDEEIKAKSLLEKHFPGIWYDMPEEGDEDEGY